MHMQTYTRMWKELTQINYKKKTNTPIKKWAKTWTNMPKNVYKQPINVWKDVHINTSEKHNETPLHIH
jgi:hypothetical protein